MMDTDNSAPLVRVWLFGAFHVEQRMDGGGWEVIEKSLWEKGYIRSFFKRLLSAHGRRLDRFTLLDDLWPDPENAEPLERYLNDAAYKLRKALRPAEVLHTFGHGSGYHLADQSLLWTDADACEALIAEAERTGRTSAAALPLLEQARDYLARGDYLEGESGLWVYARRGTLERLRYRCLIWLAEAYEQQGTMGQAEKLYNALLEENPADEDALCRLMGLLHRQHMTSQALRCYEQTKKHLKHLGQHLSPTAETFARNLLNEPRQVEVYLTQKISHSVSSSEEMQVTRPSLPDRQDISTISHSGTLINGKEDTILHDLSLSSVPSERRVILPALPQIWIDEVVFPTTIQAYEDVLALSWEAFYTSSVQRAASTVEHWLRLLALQINITSGLSDQLTDLQCRFLQLKSVIARDRADFLTAFAAIDEAIAIAFRLNRAELIASSLYRRAKIHADEQRYFAAVSYLENALPYASSSRDPLRCYISLLLAEMYSLLAPGNEEYCHKSLSLLDEVDTAVRSHGILEGDGSYVKVDVPGLYMIRGDVLRRAGQFKEAQKAIVVVRDSLSRDFTRWKGNLLLSEAQLALAERDIATSVQRSCEVLDITAVTHSLSVETKVLRLYCDICQVEPEHACVKELGVRLGIAWHSEEQKK